MIIQRLYELALRENLVGGYVPMRATHKVIIRTDGQMLSIQSAPHEVMVPVAETRTSGIAPNFMIDSSRYTFGVGLNKDRPEMEKERRSRIAECYKQFYAKASEVADATKDKGADALCWFGRRREEWLPQILAVSPPVKDNYPDGWTGSEIIAVYLEGDDHPIVHRPAIRNAWSTERQTPIPGPQVRCSVTGVMCVPARTHPMIKGVPGSQSSGAALVSFNDTSMTSHGLSQGGNAPMCRDVAEGYAAALQWLLRRDSVTGRYIHAIAKTDDSITVAWTAAPTSFINELRESVDPTSSDVRDFVNTILTGMQPDPLLDETAFYGITIGHHASRLVIKSWIETTILDIKRNVLAYHDALCISYPQWGVRLGSIIDLFNRKKNAQSTTLSIFNIAIHGQPWPLHMLLEATNQMRTIRHDATISELHTTCAVIKAVLQSLSYPGVTMALDTTNTNPAYILGRLFAVLEHMQQLALPDRKNTIRDAYFGGSMDRPADVFPHLLDLSTAHFSKAIREKPYGYTLERLKTEIIGLLPPQFPTMFSMEERGVYCIGYYHQRAIFYPPKDRKTNGENPPAEDSTTPY